MSRHTLQQPPVVCHGFSAGVSAAAARHRAAKRFAVQYVVCAYTAVLTIACALLELRTT